MLPLPSAPVVITIWAYVAGLLSITFPVSITLQPTHAPPDRPVCSTSINTGYVGDVSALKVLQGNSGPAHILRKMAPYTRVVPKETPTGCSTVIVTLSTSVEVTKPTVCLPLPDSNGTPASNTEPVTSS